MKLMKAGPGTFWYMRLVKPVGWLALLEDVDTCMV